MPQFLLVVLLLAVVVVAAYFYLKRAQARTAPSDTAVASTDQPVAASTPETPSDQTAD